MTQSNIQKVVIIGSGPAGYTAALYTARANLSPVLINGKLPGGQLTTTTEVENFPGFPDGIHGSDLMQLFETQARRFGTTIVPEEANEVDLAKRPYRIKTLKSEFFTDALIIATGANPRYLGLPAEKELLGYGVSTCATCDGAFFRNKVISVVGGGDSACEEALFLTRFGSRVVLIHRRDKLRASKIMQERVLSHPKIKTVWNSAVKEIQGTRAGGVTGLVLRNVDSGSEQLLPCDALFVAIGHIPNSQLFQKYLPHDANGYLLHKADMAATDKEGVFVCGDVADHVYRQAITAAGSGCKAAIEAERWLESQNE